MRLAVDTNVLPDILIPNPQHAEWALNCLTRTGVHNELIISEVVLTS